jgi:hypothetical protein
MLRVTHLSVEELSSRAFDAAFEARRCRNPVHAGPS